MDVVCEGIRYETVETEPVDGWRTFAATGRVLLTLNVAGKRYVLEAQEVDRNACDPAGAA